jgi:hypothetical protein
MEVICKSKIYVGKEVMVCLRQEKGGKRLLSILLTSADTYLKNIHILRTIKNRFHLSGDLRN